MYSWTALSPAARTRKSRSSQSEGWMCKRRGGVRKAVEKAWKTPANPMKPFIGDPWKVKFRKTYPKIVNFAGNVTERKAILQKHIVSIINCEGTSLGFICRPTNGEKQKREKGEKRGREKMPTKHWENGKQGNRKRTTIGGLAMDLRGFRSAENGRAADRRTLRCYLYDLITSPPPLIRPFRYNYFFPFSSALIGRSVFSGTTFS